METYEEKMWRLYKQDKKFLARWYINRWQTGGTKRSCFFRALRGVSFPYRGKPKMKDGLDSERQINTWLLGYNPCPGNCKHKHA